MATFSFNFMRNICRRLYTTPTSTWTGIPYSTQKILEIDDPATTAKAPASKPLKKAPKEGTQSFELLKYIENLPSGSNIPLQLLQQQKLLQLKKLPQHTLYLMDPLIGADIVSKVKESLEPKELDPKATILEFSCGFGTLTSELVKLFGSTHLNCFEDEDEFGKLLSNNFNVNIIPINFLTLPRYYHIDKHDGGSRTSTILNKLNIGSQKLYIFGSTEVNSLLNFTIRTLASGRVIFDDDVPWKNVTYFLILGGKSYSVLTSSPQSRFNVYRPLTVLFQMLFKFQTLGHYPRKAFLPWEYENSLTRSSKRKPRRVEYDPTVVHLIKFTPDLEVIEKIGRDNLMALYYFIKHHLFSRKTLLIPQLEQWIPGCGVKFIKQGYTVFTQFGSLTPNQILEVFLTFSSLPEYQSSSFLIAVEKYQSKIDSNDDDSVIFKI